MKTDSTFKGAYGGSITYFLYTNQISSKDMNNKFCKDIFLTIPVVIYITKNFYLLEALNDKIKLLNSAGLINFWHFHQYIDENALTRKLKGSENPKVLTLYHFEGCFGILLCGILISSIVFVVERLVGNKKKQRSST